MGQSEDTTAPAPGGSSNATSAAQPPDADPPTWVSAAQPPLVESSGEPAALSEEAPPPAPAPAPVPMQAEPPLGPVEGPELPSQFNTTFEQDPDVANGTVIIMLKDKDEPPPASLTDTIEIEKKYDGTSKGALLAKVSANETIASTIEKAMADPSVKYAEPNYILRASVPPLDQVPNDPYYGSNQWNMPLISMPKAWGYIEGGVNVLVCVIDTGIDYNHPDLAPNMASGSSTAFSGLPSVSMQKGCNGR